MQGRTHLVRGRYTLFLVLVTIITAVLFFTAPGVATSSGEGESFNETSTSDDQSGTSGGETSGGYGPDYEIPDNDFKVFYSDTPPPENDEDGDDDDDIEDVDEESLEFGDLRTIGEIEAEGEEIADAEAWGELSDTAYLITPSLLELHGWSLGDYRANQIEEVSMSFGESRVLEPWQDETRASEEDEEDEEEALIKEAYLGIVAIHGGAETVLDDTTALNPTGTVAGAEGDVLTFIDYELDEDNVKDDVVHEPEEVAGGDRQIQEMQTYYVNNVTTYREMTTTDLHTSDESDPFGETYGWGGQVHSYQNHISQWVQFNAYGHIEAFIHEEDWLRERDKIYSERTVTVSGSTSESADASTTASTRVGHRYGYTGPLSGQASSSCSTSTSGTTTENVDKEWEALNGDREIDIDKDVEITISGTVSGTCSGTVTGSADGGSSTVISGRVSGTASGTISGSEDVEIEYSYWDYWNSEEETDEGGWELQSDEYYDTHRVDLEDQKSAWLTDNNDIEVNQVSVKVNDEQYHSVIELDYPDAEAEELQALPPGFEDNGTVEMYDDSVTSEQYLWSLITFGRETYIESNLKSYTRTDYDEAGVWTENGCERERQGQGETIIEEYDCYVDEDFPRQLGGYVFSTDRSPRLISTSESGHHNPTLAGWLGRPIDAEPTATHENVTFNPSWAVLYDEFVVRNVHQPADSIVSIHGDEREITDGETRVLPYYTPEVEFIDTEEDDEYEVKLVGKDGEPLDGRDVVMTSADRTVETTTNHEGIATATFPNEPNHMQVEFAGDDLTELTDQPDKEVFYGSVTASNSVGMGGWSEFGGIVGYLADALWSLILASPLVFLYLLWRDAELGI